MNPLLAALVQAGLLSQADADRLSRQLDNNLAREYAEQQMLLAFQAGLSSQRDRLIDAVRGADGLLSVAQQNRLWAGENARLWASVRETVLDVASERAVVATIEAGAVDQWALINEAVIQEAEGYYLSPDADNVGSVQSLNATSRSRFTDAFVQWQRGTLPATGIDGLPELINALESVFGARRAEAIGVTETTRLFSMSELASARANEFVEYLMWETGNDELVCPICGPRQSQVVAKSVDGFRVPTDNVVGFPPAHVRCRCALTQLTGPALDALIADGLVAPVAGRGATAPRVPFVPTPVVEPREEEVVADRTLPAIRQRLAAKLAPQASELSAIEQEVEGINAQIADAFKNYNSSAKGEEAERLRNLVNDVWPKRLKELKKQREPIVAQMREALLGEIELPEDKRAKVILHLDDVKAGKARDDLRVNTEAATDFINRITAVTQFPNDKFNLMVDSHSGRAFATPGRIAVSSKTHIRTIVHEVGHNIETKRGAVGYAERKAFYDSRTVGEKSQKMKKLLPNDGYRDDEITIKDRWLDAYVGKIYFPDSEKSPNSEMVSMGVQYLYDEPHRLVNDDPEFFDFIIRYLQGE